MNKFEVIKKLINIIQKICNGEKFSVNFDESESDFLIKSLHLFLFLSSYPNEKNTEATKIIADSCTQNKYYCKTFVEGTNKYNELQCGILKDFLKSDNLSFEIEQNIKNRKYIIHKIYEKQGNTIKLFYKYVPNTTLYFCKINGVAIPPDLCKFIPYICSGSVKQRIIDNFTPIDGVYNVPISFFVKNYTHKNNYKNYIFRYKDTGEELVEEICLTDNSFSLIKDFKSYFKSFLITNENGEILNESVYTPSVILYVLRSVVADHGKSFNYTISNQNWQLKGMLFITNEKNKDDENMVVNRAIAIDVDILDKINTIARNGDTTKQKTFQFVYIPKTKNMDFDTLLNLCRVIELEFENEVYKDYTTCIVDDILSKYTIVPVIENLDIKLKEYLQPKIGALNVTVKPFINQTFLKSILPDGIFSINKNKYLSIYDCLHFYFDFYDPVLITDMDKIRNQGDSKKVAINYAGISTIISFIYLFINKDINDIKFCRTYKREIMFAICWFVAYLNIVKNRLFRDLTNDNIKRDIFLNDIDFSDFNIFFRDADKKPFQVLDDKYKFDIIRAIRNNICHYKFYVEIYRDGSWEYSSICFDGKINVDDKNEDLVVIKIQAGKFLDFISQEKFSNYLKEEEVLQATDIKDFCNKIKQEIIKQNKQLN